MRSAKACIGTLVILGLLIAAGNLWTAAVRSTILYSLNGVVSQKETRFEKHKGKDDVYLIALDGRSFQVDKLVYDAVQLGDRVDKQQLAKSLLVNGRKLDLAFSRDTAGMLPAMALTLVIAGITGWYAHRLADRQSVTGA